MKSKDLTPKLPYSLPPAEMELNIPINESQLGARMGGLSMYSNKFKRGYGDNVFGSDENGIWLGAADFEDAPFRVDMAGNVIAESATLGDYLEKATPGQVVSGEIIVGGSVDGKILIKNSSDVTKVRLDQDGITIDDGLLTIKNDLATTIIDSGGLVSAANFPFSSVTGSSTQTTTSTSYQDITGLSVTFTLERPQQVFVSYVVRGYASGGDLSTTAFPYALFVLDVDGVNTGAEGFCPAQIRQDSFSSPATTIYISSEANFQTILALGSGSHTLKMKFKTNNGAYTAVCDRSRTILTYFRMGA